MTDMRILTAVFKTTSAHCLFSIVCATWESFSNRSFASSTATNSNFQAYDKSQQAKADNRKEKSKGQWDVAHNPLREQIVNQSSPKDDQIQPNLMKPKSLIIRHSNIGTPARTTLLPDLCLAPRRPVIKKKIDRNLIQPRTPPRRFRDFQNITWAPRKKSRFAHRQTPKKQLPIDSESLLLAPKARRTPKSIKSNVQKRFEKITWAPKKTTYKKERIFSK